jgi:branched-chain amino acid transport system permease protein
MDDSPKRRWWDPVRVGLIAGVVGLQLALVGMITALNKQFIVSGLLTVGTALLLSVFVAAGLVASRRASGAAKLPRVAAAGVAGLLAAAVLAGLVLVGSVVNLRVVFVNASPELYHILTFTPATASPVTGIPSLLIVGLLSGLAAGLALLLPERPLKALAVGLGTTIAVGVLADQLRVILDGNFRQLHGLLGAAAETGPNALVGNGLAWVELLLQKKLLASKGLTLLGAGLLFALSAGLAWLWQRERFRVSALAERQPAARRRALRNSGFLLAALGLLALPQIVGSYHSNVLDTVGLYILMGLGLNIVVGFAGMLDLGYVAFFAIGAYTVAILTSPESFLASGNPPQAPLTFWGALPLAFLAAVLAGVLLGIPVLPLRGDYLAIVTLGFGEIIKILALSDWLKPYLGGAQGIAGIPPISLPAIPAIGFAGLTVSGPNKPQMMFYFILAACVLVAYVAVRLKDSRQGRAWMAIREDEDVAQAMGIRLVSTKLMAFAIGAGFASIAGVLFAEQLGSIYPHSFNLLISINVLALIIVGGMGNIAGVILGGLVLVGLPELLREFDEYRLLVYGALLVVMMLRRPAGLLPDAVHRRELAHASTLEPAEPDLPEETAP